MPHRRPLSRCLAAATLALTVLLAFSSPALAVQETVDTTGMTNGKVFAVERVGNTIYVGGQFTNVLKANGTVAYRADNIAAFDASTGVGISTFRLPVLQPGGTPFVRSLVASPDGTRLYVGGKFSSIGGVARQHIARIDLTTGTVDASFAPVVGDAASIVYDILLGEGAVADRVYFGGIFKTVDGVTRTRVAAVTSAGALISTWKPRAGGNAVRALTFAVDRATVFIAGSLNQINGEPRVAIGRVDAVTGALHSWTASSTAIQSPMHCYDVVATDTRLFAGCGKGPNYAIALSVSTGAQVWKFSTVGNVQVVELNASGSELFIGGHFGTGRLQQTVCVNKQLHGLALLNATTGIINCSWVPQLAPFGSNYQGVWALQLTETHLWAGGLFHSVAGDTQKYLGRFALVP
jgi:hypothetical protein